MRKTVAKTTLALATGALILTGCADAEPDEPTPTTAATSTAPQSASTPSPTESAAPTKAEDLVGDWSDKKAKWTVHFKSDGTFVEDLNDVSDLREGKYQVQDGEVLLIGGDGNTDKGSIEGSTLVFQLGTLKRNAGQ